MTHDPGEHWLEACKQAARSRGNQLGFAIRNFLNWKARPFGEQPEPERDPFQQKPSAMLKGQALLSRYDLSATKQRATGQRFLENLAYLEWLDAFYHRAPQEFQRLSQSDCLNWLDAGSKNWSYVDALDAFVRRHTPGAYRLDGVELDPNRRYQDFTTREQAAQAYAKPLIHAQYHGMDLMDWGRKAQIISHFLPFVVKEPLLSWGLPLAYFQPQALLRHLCELLEPGGLLLIVNQGEWEAEAQEKLLLDVQFSARLKVKNLGQLPASFIEYQYPRYGWLCIKQES